MDHEQREEANGFGVDQRGSVTPPRGNISVSSNTKPVHKSWIILSKAIGI